MNAVVPAINAHNHHPEWSNVYNRVNVRWTTHRPAGLSAKDTTLAEECDVKAAELEAAR